MQQLTSGNLELFIDQKLVIQNLQFFQLMGGSKGQLVLNSKKQEELAKYTRIAFWILHSAARGSHNLPLPLFRPPSFQISTKGPIYLVTLSLQTLILTIIFFLRQYVNHRRFNTNFIQSVVLVCTIVHCTIEPIIFNHEPSLL